MQIKINIKKFAPKISFAIPATVVYFLSPFQGNGYDHHSSGASQYGTQKIGEMFGEQLLKVQGSAEWIENEESIRKTPQDQMEKSFKSKQFQKVYQRIRRNADSKGKELSQLCLRIYNMQSRETNRNVREDVLKYCNSKYKFKNIKRT